MRDDEFTNTILMNPASQHIKQQKTIGFKKNSPTAPDKFDWRNHNVVTQVQDQGFIGTSWAFSAAGNIEGQWALAGNQLTELSAQKIVDCDASGRSKCGEFGGLPSNSLEYIIQNGGLPSNKDHSSCQSSGRCYACRSPGYNKTTCNQTINQCREHYLTCDSKAYPIASKIEDWYSLSSNETELKQQLTEVGPVSIMLNAKGLQFYKSGIWAPKNCNPSQLNHAALLVGYGVDEKKVEFWIVKNSWGVKWGEEGYFRIKRGVGMCGVNSYAVTSVVDAKKTKELFTTQEIIPEEEEDNRHR